MKCGINIDYFVIVHSKLHENAIKIKRVLVYSQLVRQSKDIAGGYSSVNFTDSILAATLNTQVEVSFNYTNAFEHCFLEIEVNRGSDF